jgi:hypothetical protein
MRLLPQARPGSWCSFVLGADGRPVYGGDGSHKAVVTGNVVDRDNNLIGEFYEIASKAVQVWEKFAVDHGLLQRAAAT